VVGQEGDKVECFLLTIEQKVVRFLVQEHLIDQVKDVLDQFL